MSSEKQPRSLLKVLIQKNVISLIVLCLILSAGIFIGFFGLTTGNKLDRIFTPFDYTGDGVAVASQAKMITMGTWKPFQLPQSPYLGYPSSYILNDYPFNDHVTSFSWWILSFFTKNHFLVFNIYFFLTYFLCAFSFYFLCRAYRISQPIAVLVSFAFSFLPYHAIRYHHIFLASYFLVPFMLYYLLRITGVNPLKSILSNKRKLFAFIFIHVLFGFSNVYYAFFYCFLLLTFALFQTVKRRSFNPLYFSVFAISLTTITLITTVIPNLSYRQQHGRNTVVAIRNPVETEIYSLKPINMILPSPEHRISIFKKIRNKHFTFIPGVEGSNEYLGLIAVLSLTYLFGHLLFPHNKKHSLLQNKIQRILLLCFLFSIAGGIGAVFAFYVTPEFRALNRISVFIAGLCLLFAGLFLDLRTRSLKPVVKCLAILFLFLITFVDLLPKSMRLKSQDLENYMADVAFFDNLEEKLPEKSKILQLPYVPFPEEPPMVNMKDYDHWKAFIATDKIYYFSYGAVKGRPDSDLIRNISSLPLDFEKIKKYNFDAILIDRNGFQDHGEKLISELQSKGYEMVSGGAGNRLSLFVIK